MNVSRRIRARLLTVAMLLLALSACRVTDLRLWDGVERTPDAYEVEHLRDLAYYDGPQADRVRHRLDVFLPKGKKDFPVVVLLHGGAWLLGDNRCCGLYSSVGEYLASQGIGVVMPNYRLSPAVKHPEHVKDVARAFAWTKNHIGEHGGRTDQIFLVGHSAGGHLAALLASDEKYLKEQGCQGTDVKGVVSVSGVLRIPEGTFDVFLGGSGPLSVRVDEMLPLRGDSAPVDANSSGRRGLPIRVNISSVVFGDDSITRLHASPLHHVRPGMPPFLFLNADKDLPFLPGMAEEMHRAMLLHGCDSRLGKIENRNHNSILFKAIESRDPVARAIVDFVREGVARD